MSQTERDQCTEKGKREVITKSTVTARSSKVRGRYGATEQQKKSKEKAVWKVEKVMG